MKLLLIGILLISSVVFAAKEKKSIFRDINVKEFVNIIKDRDVVIIDLRTVQELESGYVEGAVNIDFYLSDFKAKLDALDKDKKYVIYCRSGNRSGQTMKIMKKLKFKEVYNLLGGVGALVRAGYPLVEPD